MKSVSQPVLSFLSRGLSIAAIGVAGALASVSVMAQSIVVASTTSTEQSGLFSHLLPEFKKVSGIDVKVVALGTGQAIDTARRGDADVLFVHDKIAEEKFVADGFAGKRQDVMYNDFVLVGPQGRSGADQGQRHRGRAQEGGERQRGLCLAR